MVGHVEECGEFAGLDHGNHLVPLRGCDVIAGGVVAAGVQQHDGAGGRSIQCGQHAVKIDAAQAAVGALVEVGVSFDREACVGEQGAVVFPAGVGNQHLSGGADFFQEVSPNFQTASTANGLHGGHATALDHIGVGTEHQCFHTCVIGRNTVDGQVATGSGLFHHGLFCGLHTLQQWQFAVVVEIHTHAEVDFVGVGVCVVLLVQTQDRVAGGHFDSGKQ